jgi:pimeloyl-ACP methyl ester carboxylesterase
MYRVLAIDVVGEANRSRPTIPITSLDEYLAWFTELTDYLGVKHFHLVGNSFGAFTATYYAMHLPDRVRTLTLIGPAATFAKMPQFYLHMFLRKLFHLLFPWMPGRERMMHNACRYARRSSS